MLILLGILQFTSLAMLGWLAAALAPIVIHLFTRKRFRKVTWAAMEYLLAAMKKNQRRIQLEQWLLLAIRTLLLLVLALALADPILSRTSVLSFGGAVPPTHYVFVLDATYSMDLRVDGATRFDAAKDAVREVIKNSAQGDGYSLVLLADPPQTIIAEPAFDKDDLLEELDAATMTHGLGDFSATLAEAEAIAASAREQNSRLAATTIVFYGDLERTTWEPAASDSARLRLAKLAENASLSIVDLGLEEARNVAITEMRVRETPVTLDREFTVQADLASFGAGGRGAQAVTLLVDEEAVAQQNVELNSSGQGTAAFRHRFSSPGDHTVQVRLAADPLEVDNRRWTSVPVRDALRALCVYSRPGETRFVALALEPEKSSVVRTRVDEASDASLLERDLSQYDAVFLVNLPQLDAEQSQVLRAYVEAGGGLVVFPGDLTRIEDFMPPEAPALLPASFISLAPAGAYRFAPLDYRHELIAPFRGFERAGLLTTPIGKYVKLEPLERDDVHVALRFDTGDPAIVEGRLGNGRVILFATAASPEPKDRSTNPPTPWSLLATWPSFPPLVQESLSLAARSDEEGRNRLVGESISSTVQNAQPDTRLTLNPPAIDGRTGSGTSASRQVRLQSQGDTWQWSYGDTLLSGIYELKLGAPIDRVERYAINIDPQESGLQRIGPEQLPKELKPLATADGSGTITAGGTTASYSWFRPLLLLVLALIAVESLLARWFGGGRA